MVPPLTIGPLASTSPSAAAEMTICRLRAGLSSCSAADAWVLHDPRQWLGTAFHSLIEKARNGTAGPNLEAAWDSEIALFVERAAAHPFDRRFVDAARWPSYFLVRQRALGAAAAVWSGSGSTRSGVVPHGGQRHSGTERRLVARAGRLVGRPDRFDRTSVTDYKSNLPDAATTIGAEILRRNRRQIQIYAAMIAETLGYWPAKGIIAGASGETITFDLSPAECDAEADKAVQDLERWNSTLASSRHARDLANPSASSCQNCLFQLVCPAFWIWIARSISGSPQPGVSPAAAGSLKSVQLGNDGDLQTVSLSNVMSTQPNMSEASLVTRRSIHGSISPNLAGSECRIVGAVARQDGRLSANFSTVLLPTDQIPQIALRMGAPPALRAAIDGRC
jgi:PD-(D/E)XK nuclease superfamily